MDSLVVQYRLARQPFWDPNTGKMTGVPSEFVVVVGNDSVIDDLSDWLDILSSRRQPKEWGPGFRIGSDDRLHGGTII